MAALLDGWESDFDGKRWFYRYKATGMEQYHFPRPGDEFAEHLIDAGTGSVELTPEDSLVIKQTKRSSISEWGHDARCGSKTSGSKRGKSKSEIIEEDEGMSATGYFDPSSFMYSYDISPVGDEDGDDSGYSAFDKKARGSAHDIAPGFNPEPAPPIPNSEPILNLGTGHVELPEGGQQMWSPVGFVAELATQDTVKCAEELAPVELDATPFTPAPIQTDVVYEVAELPTHRTPTEQMTLASKPTHAVAPTDSYPLVSASFAYPPLKTDTRPLHGVSSSAPSTVDNPISQDANPTDLGQNKYQSWKPMQGVVEQQCQTHNQASGSLPQSSVLQNQNSELGDLEQKNSGNAGSPKLGDVPSTLAPPSGPRIPTSDNSSTPNCGQSPVPASLQPAQQPSNQHPLPGTGARHESISVMAAAHDLSYAPSVLKPGGRRPNDSSIESQGSSEIVTPHSSGQTAHGTVPSHRLSEQSVLGSSDHNARPHVTRVHTVPSYPSSANTSSPPRMNGAPGFLFFHEISSTPSLLNHGSTIHAEEMSPNPTEQANSPHCSGAGHANSQSHISNSETFPVAASSGFVKRHSSKSSAVSSIAPENQDSNLATCKPASTPSDETFEVMSVISNFTPSGTPTLSSGPSRPPTHTVPDSASKPSPTSMSEGLAGQPNIAAGARPQATNEQSPSPPMNIQQASTATHIANQASHATVINTFKPTSIPATPMTGVGAISSSGNVGSAAAQAASITRPHQNASSAAPGSVIPNQSHSSTVSSQDANLGNVSMASGPSRPQGKLSNPLPPKIPATTTTFPSPGQTNNTTHINQAHEPVAHTEPNHDMGNIAQQVNSNTVNTNSSAQMPPVTASSVLQGSHQHHEQNNVYPQSTVRPSAVGYSHASTVRPNLQHAATTVLSSQQSSAQPPGGYQAPGSAPAQISPQRPPQQSSPVAQPVSPLQSQVSSPAQSIVSLHVSQTSTPSLAFSTLTNTGNSMVGPDTNVNHATPVSYHAQAQQAGNTKPPLNSHSSPLSPNGNAQTQGPSQPKPPAQPYPMLPGQVTPLPSQMGSTPIPLPSQQSMPTNHPKPAANLQQAPHGQQVMQVVSGGSAQQHMLPSHSSQMNLIPNPVQGNTAHGQVPSQAQIKPPQQQIHTVQPGANYTAGNQPTANKPQSQQMAYHPSPPAPIQSHNPQMMPPSSAPHPPVGGQQTFSSPQTAQAQAQQLVQSPGITSPVAPTPAKPFNSAQATAALTDAGKGMKKWAKKMLKNPGIKQTTFAIGGAVVAESFGVNAVAGAQLANSLYANAQRPQLTHAQTAPPQPHGIPNTVPQQQQQSMQMGQQSQLGRPQQMHPQPNHQPGRPQQGHPQQGHPQQGYQQAAHPQPGRPQQVHHQQAHPQQGHLQQGQLQPGRPQAGQQPVGTQPPGQPGVSQNPAIATGVSVSFNGQAQAQIGLNQQQQYPMVRPAMIGSQPPPGTVSVQAPGVQGQAQVNFDANMTAVLIGSAVGAAFRPDHPQQSQGGRVEGHGQPDHNSHAESHSAGNHGYSAENHAEAHEPAYNSYYTAQAPTTYTDNNTMTADTTYFDSTSHSMNNTTYVDNTDVTVINNNYVDTTEVAVNNSTYADNSTYGDAGTTYADTNYVDATAYGSTDTTYADTSYYDATAYGSTDVTVDVSVESYTDGNTTSFSMEETINIASSSDLATTSADYSGGDWGDWF